MTTIPHHSGYPPAEFLHNHLCKDGHEFTCDEDCGKLYNAADVHYLCPTCEWARPVDPRDYPEDFS